MKKTKKVVSRVYKWIKLLLKAFTLGSTLYSIYVATSSVDGITIILTTLMIILWVLQVLLELIVLIIEPKAKLVKAGVLTDIKPIIKAINMFKRDNIEIDYSEYKKELAILDKKVEIKKPVNKKRIPLPISFNKIVKKMQKQVVKQEKIEFLDEIKEKDAKLYEKEKKSQIEDNAEIVYQEEDIKISEPIENKKFLLVEKGKEKVANFFKKRDKKSLQENEDDEFEKVKKLKELLDIGAITEEEYETKKKQILGL